jgi:hypothetical protein
MTPVPTLPICTVVTQNCLSEFLLFKTSVEKFHDCDWFISCDEYVNNYLSESDSLHRFQLIDSDDCDHVINDQKQNDNFTKLILTKFDICDIGLREYPFVLLIDNDMIFTNPIDDNILWMLERKQIDAFVCPHMTDGFGDEKITGYFNCGMVFISSKEFVEHWRVLTKNHKQLGLYYEQKPLELVIKAFVTGNLPMNYNIGWWRFLTPQTEKRLELFNVQDQNIFYGNLPAVNFHFHTLKKLKYPNQGEFLKDMIFSAMDQGFNMNYRSILEKYTELKNEDL